MAVVEDLERDLEGIDYPLNLVRAQSHRQLAGQMRVQIHSHLLPRLRQEDGPAVVVVGGSTGGGKSTIINSLAGQEISEAGVIRPTTLNPVLAVNPESEPDLDQHPVLELAEVKTCEGIPPGLVLIDAPDLDSVHKSNRDIASTLMEVADLWVFVTTASRYGDALPWRVLEDAHARGIGIAVVLNRVAKKVLVEVRTDLMRRLAQVGLGDTALFVIPDVSPHRGPLDPELVSELSQWLKMLAGRHQSVGLVRRTAEGVWGSLRQQLRLLSAGLSDQVTAAQNLSKEATAAAAEQAAVINTKLLDGTAAAGTPTARWLSLASTGGPLAPLVARGARVRKGIGGRGRDSRDQALSQLASDAASAAATLLAGALRVSDQAIRVAWAKPSLGANELLARVLPLADADTRAQSAIDAWRDDVYRHVNARVQTTPALTPEGFANLVISAGAGITGALAITQALLGDKGLEMCEYANRALGSHASAAVEWTAGPYVTAVELLELDPAAAAGLRLRAQELGVAR